MGNWRSWPSPQSSQSPQSGVTILSLPDEILLEIVSRLPRDSLPSLPLVCHRISKVLHHPNFLPSRLIPTLHLFNFSHLGFFTSVSTALNGSDWSWSPSIRRPLPPSFIDISLVSLGRSIYILGAELALRYDTWTLTSAPLPLTLFPRRNIAAAAVNGKVYVAGGDHPAVEEFDPASNEWRVVSQVPALRSRCFGAGAAGVFYIIDTYCAGYMNAYDVSAGEWLTGMPAPVHGGGRFVVGTCVTPAGHVYIVSSHRDEELDFWRWEGRGKEWMMLETPVVPQRAGLACKSVRFNCVAAGDDRVIAVVNVSPLNIGSGWIARDVLVYDVAHGHWSRGPNLPLEFHSEPALAFTPY